MARTRVYAPSRTVAEKCPGQQAWIDRMAADMDEPGSDEEDPDLNTWTDGCQQAWDALADTSAEMAIQVALVDTGTDGFEANGAADVRAALQRLRDLQNLQLKAIDSLNWRMQRILHPSQIEWRKARSQVV